MARAYKTVPASPPGASPDGTSRHGGPPIGEVIAARRCRRSFAAGAIGLSELSTVLQWSYGITGEVECHGGEVQRFRARPQLALFIRPRSTWACTPSVVSTGICHYEVPEKSLTLLSRGDPSARLYEICCGRSMYVWRQLSC